MAKHAREGKTMENELVPTKELARWELGWRTFQVNTVINNLRE